MSTTNDVDKPAFPCSGKDGLGRHYLQRGMTLRDWFAGQAMQSMVSVATEMSLKGIGPAPSPETIAYWAYCQSDAMLAAREEKEGTQ
jgi:hypothetical protein